MKSFLWGALLLCAWPAGSQEAAVPPAAAQRIDHAAKSRFLKTRAKLELPTEGVFDRLAARLATIPNEWDSLPSPLIPVSGQSVEEVLATASDGQTREASGWLARLASNPPGERPALIQAELGRRSPTEVDLWLPQRLLQPMESPADAAVLEAWMQWAFALGRKDALLEAASFALDIVRIRKGAPALSQVIRLWAELPLVPASERSQALLQSSLAKVFFQLGDNPKAFDAYRKARELFVAVRDQLGQGDTWKGEAEILLRLGENKTARDAYGTARQLFRAARQPIRATGEPLRLGHSWYGEAEIIFQLGEDTKALYAYGRAREAYLAAGSKLGQGNTLRGAADVFLFRLGENQRALKAYREARDLFIAVGDLAGQGTTWLGEARVFNQEAERLRREVNTQSEIGAGLLLTALHRTAKAARAAVTNYQNAGVITDQIAALLLQAYTEPPGGGTLVALGLKSAPENPASQAIRLSQIWRSRMLTDNERTSQDERIGIRWAYELLVPRKAREKGQAAEALQLAEEARSRVLLDLLATPPDRGEIASPANLTDRRRLEREIWQIEEQLRGSLRLDQQQELRARRRLLDQELEWNRYQRIAAQGESFPQGQPLDTAKIQDLTRETGPLLLYYVAASEVWGFLILPETAEIHLQSMAISWSELEQRVRALIHDLANPLYERRAEREAYNFWSLLIRPFLDRLPKSGPLVIVPHGPLHELPFEALRDIDRKRLFERWQISITPSISALAFARRGHAAPSPGDSFLGFSAGRGLNLPGEEIAEISGLFGANRADFHPTEANYQNYVKLVAQARHLLISTRGVHIEGSRTETYLEIESTPEIHDSRLTAAEIATIPLNAELVALAACDTSHGRALLSDERLDLTRSFLIARAAAVLATRWKVPEDSATSRFLVDFYQAYRGGGPQGAGLRKDEALNEARHRSRERGDPAQVWAAWTLVGDAR